MLTCPNIPGICLSTLYLSYLMNTVCCRGLVPDIQERDGMSTPILAGFTVTEGTDALSLL